MSDQLSSDLASLRIERGGRNPARRNVLLYLLAVAALGVLAVVAYAFAKPRLEAEFFKTEVDVTEISLVSPAQASIELSSTGHVVPQVVSLVSAKIPGRVAEIHVKEGDDVKTGDLLMVLDAADIKSAKRAAESRVAAARARAQVARATVAEVQVQLEREKRLSAEGLSAKALSENLTAKVAALEESVRAADAEVNTLAAEVKTTDVNLGYLKIYSPITGRVVNKPPQVGELVGALTLTPLTIEIADMSTLTVETDVPEARLEQVRAKAPCEIVLDAYPSRRLRGEVLEVSPKVNRQKATVKVKVKFTDDTTDVLPEMAARVSFLTKALEAEALKEPPKLVVPAAAVADRAGGKVVYVVDGDQVKMVTVTLGAPFAGGFQLVSGPAAGTKVVKNPAPALADGQKIKQRGNG
jgi:RND family efflux transporter MFP subunit